jgi:hypothetical protein
MHLRSVAGRKGAAAPRRPRAVASVADTPIWLSLLALIAITMWPSALVGIVQLVYRLTGW